MKKLLAVSMAAVMTLSLSCTAFADEETVADITDFEWAAMKAVLDESGIIGNFVSFDDAGMKRLSSQMKILKMNILAGTSAKNRTTE
jgi:hypothetical protein